MAIDPRSALPLKPVEFLILLALSEEDMHGYALTREIGERSDETIRLEPGNLYRVLKRLLADGLIASTEHRAVAELENERRRYYAITALGLCVAALEADRLRTLLASKAARGLARRLGAAGRA
jgi:DNA-binding PadR family transcriptional regulator